MDLAAIFEKQRELAVRHEVPLDLIERLKSNDEETVLEAKDLLKKWHVHLGTALVMESSELLDWAPWKHWSERSGNKLVTADQMYTDDHIKEVRIEIVDILHFMVETALVFGMSAEDLFNDYMNKNAVNHERKDTVGY